MALKRMTHKEIADDGATPRTDAAAAQAVRDHDPEQAFYVMREHARQLEHELGWAMAAPVEALREIKEVVDLLATTTQQENDKGVSDIFLDGQVKAFRHIAMSIESRINALILVTTLARR